MGIKIVDNKTEMVTLGTIKLGEVFRWQNHLCVRTEPFFSLAQIHEYFDDYYAIEDVEDLENQGFNTYNCWSLSNSCPLRLDITTKVEKINVELHIV